VDVTRNTCTTRDSISVAYSINPVVTIVGDSSICNGDNTILSANIVGGILPYSYSWTGGGTGNSENYSPTVNTTYLLTVTDSAGCTGSDDMQVDVTNYPVVFLGNDTTLCTTPTLQLDAGNPGFGYSWQDASANQTLTASSSGIYWVDVTNNNCTTRDSITLTFDSPQVVNLGPDQFICLGEIVTLNATNPNASYTWSTGASTAQINALTDGTYWVGVTKCYTTVYDSITLTNDIFVVVTDTNVNAICGENNGYVIALPSGGIGPYTYVWTGYPDSTATLSGVPEGTYTVTVTDAEGCTSTQTFDILCTIPDLVVTQLLTPNSDGKNDTWIIQNIANYPDNRVVVYNRWGNEVFRAESYANDWDGKSNSSLSIGSDYLPSGTYFYTVDLYGNGSDVRTGYIELYR
jgi:gliding motility-associated-like protein